jgi:hypothetical protein
MSEWIEAQKSGESRMEKGRREKRKSSQHREAMKV